MRRQLLSAALGALFLARPAAGEVTRVEVQSRADLAAGKTFGSVGAYERLSGRIYFSIDPKNTANQIVTDLDKAPRNAKGRVEFSSDFYLLKPKDMARANGAVLYEVSNRGGKGMLGFFNHAAGGGENETGDGFLMQNGFTLLWLGWQFDVPQRDGLLRVYAPVATDAGKPITGLVRSEIIVTAKANDASLSDRNHVPYAVADPADAANALIVRDTVAGARRTLPRSDWRFTDKGVELTSGFQPGKIYEVVYKAKDPAVVGVGPAAIRDAIAYLKHADPQPLGIGRGSIDRAIAFGISQSGRFLRTFLYYGFNEDEAHRKAFDGVMAHVAGAGRGSFNHRFAQPSRDGHPFLNLFYPTDIFPFTDAEQTDPETGAKAGLLSRVRPELLPKVFYTNSSYEYWGRAASLVHTSADGKSDAPLLDGTRVYMFAGGQHGPARFPPARGIGQQPSNPNDYRFFMKPLLLAMDGWVKRGTPPPPSRYARIDDGSLTALPQFRFPALPGVAAPTDVYTAYRLDLGPSFATKGIVTKEPPELGKPFPMRVPQVDGDGNEIGGLKMPEVAVPLATYTGWNLFNAESGPTDTLSSMQGSYIPFAPTRADREQSRDPRRSIEERYRDRADYLEKVGAAGRELARAGYLLEADLPRIVEQAGRHWDLLAARTGPSSR